MKKILLSLPLIIALASCGNESSNENTAAETTPVTNNNPIPLEAPNASTPNDVKSDATPTAAPAAQGKVNPPHGEPGHDCNLPVGAPLTGNTGGTSTPQMVMPTAAPAANPNIPANNPPHGQPGHVCG